MSELIITILTIINVGLSIHWARSAAHWRDRHADTAVTLAESNRVASLERQVKEGAQMMITASVELQRKDEELAQARRALLVQTMRNQGANAWEETS